MKNKTQRMYTVSTMNNIYGMKRKTKVIGRKNKSSNDYKSGLRRIYLYIYTI